MADISKLSKKKKIIEIEDVKIEVKAASVTAVASVLAFIATNKDLISSREFEDENGEKQTIIDIDKEGIISAITTSEDLLISIMTSGTSFDVDEVIDLDAFIQFEIVMEIFELTIPSDKKKLARLLKKAANLINQKQA